MIQLFVKEFLILKGLQAKPVTLIKMGINRFIAIKLLNNQVKNLSLETLTVLCANLDCTPNELFNFVPKGISVPPNNALHRIARSGSIISPVDFVNILKPENIHSALEHLKNMVIEQNNNEKK